MIEREAEILGHYSTPNLRRNVLTVDGKRWQLWGKGIRGREADAIIAQIYSPEEIDPTRSAA